MNASYMTTIWSMKMPRVSSCAVRPCWMLSNVAIMIKVLHEAEKKPKADKPVKAEKADKPKGKGFWGGLKDAFGGGKKKEAKPKDEA